MGSRQFSSSYFFAKALALSSSELTDFSDNEDKESESNFPFFETKAVYLFTFGPFFSLCNISNSSGLLPNWIIHDSKAFFYNAFLIYFSLFFFLSSSFTFLSIFFLVTWNIDYNYWLIILLFYLIYLSTSSLSIIWLMYILVAVFDAFKASLYSGSLDTIISFIILRFTSASNSSFLCYFILIILS